MLMWLLWDMRSSMGACPPQQPCRCHSEFTCSIRVSQMTLSNDHVHIILSKTQITPPSRSSCCTGLHLQHVKQ